MRQLFPPVDAPAEHAADPISDDDLADRLAYPEGRPWIRAVFVATLDGAAQGPDGRAGSISGPPDRRFFAMTRAMADVILVGARTARVEGYGPAGLSFEHRRIRERRGQGSEPAPIAVVSASLDIPEALLDDPRTIVVTTGRSDRGRREELAHTVDVVVAGDDELDPHALVRALTERGHTRISCEGGPLLYAELLAAGLVDDQLLVYAPMLFPGDALRVTQTLHADRTTPVRLHGLFEEDGFLFTHWLTAR